MKRTLPGPIVTSTVAVLVTFLTAFLGSIAPARAVDLALKFEPGIAKPVTSPQVERYFLGGAFALKGLVGLGDHFDAGVGISFLGLAPATGSAATQWGTAWAPSLGLRFKPKLAPDQFLGMNPWVDADLLFVRTGPLDRLGFNAAIGLAIPIGEAREFWIGPFLRYMHVFDDPAPGLDTRHSQTVILGLSLEFGADMMKKSDQTPCPDVVPCPAQKDCPLNKPCPTCEAAAYCPPQPAALSDRDKDGVPDELDFCPDVPVAFENRGCPKYEKLVIKPDKLELKEKIQFEWNTANIEKSSHPALDEVAQALNDNKGFRVVVEGHASSEGTNDYNQDLSEDRAKAVLAYLAKKGVPQDRLKSKGFSSSRPISTNKTIEGREDNRRVEFVVFFVIAKEESAK